MRISYSFDLDALRVRLRSTGIEEATFKFGDEYFKVMDVGGQRSERTKWKNCFDCVTSVLYVAGLSEYDQVLRGKDLYSSYFLWHLLYFWKFFFIVSIDESNFDRK